jgi:hypothetical protein
MPVSDLRFPPLPCPVRIGRSVDCLGGAASRAGDFDPSTPDRSHHPLSEAPIAGPSAQPSTRHRVYGRSSRFSA